jgi:hypothetical protein
MSKMSINTAKAEAIRREAAEARAIAERVAAYRAESDPLAMEMLRGEVDGALGRVPTVEDIAAKVAEIKTRFPKNVL